MEQTGISLKRPLQLFKFIDTGRASGYSEPKPYEVNQNQNREQD